jgi:isopentenyldiphosphate isomerase
MPPLSDAAYAAVAAICLRHAANTPAHHAWFSFFIFGALASLLLTPAGRRRLSSRFLFLR